MLTRTTASKDALPARVTSSAVRCLKMFWPIGRRVARAAVKMMRVERPAEYVRVMRSILPKERREPIEVRKATLASIPRKGVPGVRLNEHLEHDDGEARVFRHACGSGAERRLSRSAWLALPIGAVAGLA